MGGMDTQPQAHEQPPRLPDLSTLFNLHHKVALITGGGSGLGRAIAEGFAQFGATVVVVDYNLAAAQDTVNHIAQGQGVAHAVQCDVSQAAQVEAAIATALATCGQIDILAAIAGVGDRSPAEAMTDAQWDRVIDINLKGVWLFNRAVGQHMIQRGGGGSIINMSSIASLVGLTTGNANYSAAKGAVNALTRDLAVEWAKHRIRVNAIAPVQFKTPLVKNLLDQKPETEAYFINRIPLGRLGEVHEIVGPALFLASDAASMVTGHVLVVDGGNTIAY